MKVKQVSRTNPNAWTETRIDEDGKLYVQNHERVDDLLRLNHALRNEPKSSMTMNGRRHVARIPLTLYHELRRKGIIGDQKKLRAWLNDPDNRLWRTSGGKL